MFQAPSAAVIWPFLLNISVLFLPQTASSSRWCHRVTRRETSAARSGGGLGLGLCSGCNGTSRDAAQPPQTGECHSFLRMHDYHHGTDWKSPGLQTFCTMETHGPVTLPTEKSLSSSSTPGPWGHSLFSQFKHMSKVFRLRNRRSSLTRYNPGHTLPQVQTVVPPSSFGVKFQKCAQVKTGPGPPLLMFSLVIHNMSPAGGTNLSQVAIRDSIFGIVPLKSGGTVVERGYQAFAIDSLSAGSQIVVNYTAQIMSHKTEVLDLPAFLTFSNLSQNDVSMFGPLKANLTLRVNSTDRIYPNHGVHFAGFVGGFIVSLVILMLGFLFMTLIGPRARLSLLRKKRSQGDSDQEYADCDMSEAVKDEATFEDKIVDIMVLEDPQNMYQSLENLEMSTLLHATNSLEATRVQIYKDVLSIILADLHARGQASGQAQQRLLSVLHGQLLGMEGRLKEERGARMAALAAQCNLETREEMEAEHHGEATEKAQAEQLCQHADQQELLRCSVLLEKLHKLNQSRLQRVLLVRHEEASAKVQRQIIEWRRVELHKIFSEELEEATKMGELEKSAAKSLQHSYFEYQDQLEQVLDVVLANLRYVLAERHAQRKFLVHSLHSLNGLISDTFTGTSSHLESWFGHIKRGSTVSTEQIDQLEEKAQKELVMVRQRLDEVLSQERRAMRCGLIKKRRELISNLLRAHKQREKDLFGLSKDMEGRIEVDKHLHCWQNLLTAHSLELAELVNNLDEEAAADIRKVTMRVIQSAVAEVKAIQPSAAQTLLTLLPPGPHRVQLQAEPEAGSGPAQTQGGSAVLHGQERLHQEGKAALHTLSCTREALQEAMERELQEQRELRAHCGTFFRCLCLSQLTMSEDERLRMKLEFQKCLSVMDRCLVLPHAVSRAKLHRALAAWRKDGEQRMMNPQSKGKSSEASQRADTCDLFLFQKKLKDRIQLFEKEKEMESSFTTKVLEEMGRERERELHSQADSLAVQMATLHYQKAERRTKVLETSRALLTLHGLLIRHLREGKSLQRQELAQSIQTYCAGLEEAERRLQKETRELIGSTTEPEFDRTRDEDEGLFELRQDARMLSILQEALYKRHHVAELVNERSRETTADVQVMENLKEQLELKRLYANCDQDVVFASQLIRQTQVSVEVLLEALRLLLPTLPESELLSITDALCPKSAAAASPAEDEPSRCAAASTRLLPAKLREEVVHGGLLDWPGLSAEGGKVLERRRSLMEKLLPVSVPPAPGDAGVKAPEDGCPGAPRPGGRSAPQQADAGDESAAEAEEGILRRSDAEDSMKTADASEPASRAAGQKLFVFRDQPEPRDRAYSKRKRKRNFLNLKKCSVAPTQAP